MTMEKNLIVLRSVYGKVGQIYYIQPVKNPKTGRFPDCVRRVNSMGDMIMSDEDRNSNKVLIPENRVFEIQDGIQFDLEDPYQKAEWECIRYAPIIAPSRDARDSHGNLLIDGEIAEGKTNARYGIAELYVEAPGVEVTKKVNRTKQIFDAQSYIFNDTKGAEGRVLKARLLGKNMRNAPDSEVTEYLLNIASKDPKRIIDLYTGTDMSLRLLLIEARERHVIVVKNKVYVYGDDIVLGISDDAVIAFLKDPKNAKLLELIKRDTYPELEEDNDEAVESKSKSSKAKK